MHFQFVTLVTWVSDPLASLSPSPSPPVWLTMKLGIIALFPAFLLIIIIIIISSTFLQVECRAKCSSSPTFHFCNSYKGKGNAFGRSDERRQWEKRTRRKNKKVEWPYEQVVELQPISSETLCCEFPVRNQLCNTVCHVLTLEN